MIVDNRSRLMMSTGAVLFLISLIQGLGINYFTIPRMALSAHQAGIEGGIVLILFGLIWKYLSHKEKGLNVILYTSIGGMYVVWLAITLSSILGASKALPIAGESFSASYASEITIQGLIMFGGTLCLISAVMVVIGLCRSPAEKVIQEENKA